MNDPTTIQTIFADILSQIAGLLPRLLAAAVVLILGWLLARLLAGLTRRVADRIGLNDLVARSGLADGLAQAQISRPVADLIAWLVFWLVMLSTILVALDNLGLTVATVPLQGLLGYLPHLLAAILVLVLGALLAQFLGQATQAAAASMGVEFHRQLGQAVRVLLLGAVGIIAVEQLGVDVSLFTEAFINVLTILAGGLALAFALGGREVTRNVLAGFYAREMYSTGDRVQIDGQEGTLEAIGSLNAEVSIGEDRLILPNTDLIEKRVLVRGQDQVDP